MLPLLPTDVSPAQGDCVSPWPIPRSDWCAMSRTDMLRDRRTDARVDYRTPPRRGRRARSKLASQPTAQGGDGESGPSKPRCYAPPQRPVTSRALSGPVKRRPQTAPTETPGQADPHRVQGCESSLLRALRHWTDRHHSTLHQERRRQWMVRPLLTSPLLSSLLSMSLAQLPVAWRWAGRLSVVCPSVVCPLAVCLSEVWPSGAKRRPVAEPVARPAANPAV